MDKKRRKWNCALACLLAAALSCQALWADGGMAFAAGIQEMGQAASPRTARKIRTTTLELSEEEQENPEEGWSWKKDPKEEYDVSYILKLDSVNFEVPDGSAVSLPDGIYKVNIILSGENRITSTNQTGEWYDGCGIYLSNTSGVRASISGTGSLSVKGAKHGIYVNRELELSGVSIDAQSDDGTDAMVIDGGFIGGNLEVAGGSILKTTTLSLRGARGANLFVTGSSLYLSMERALPQGQGLIGIKVNSINNPICNITNSNLVISGPEGAHPYAAISMNEGTMAIQDSTLDIRNVEQGICVEDASQGAIRLNRVTGKLLCSGAGQDLPGGSPALSASKVDVLGSTLYAQTGDHIFTYGDCSLPEEVKVLEVTGGLTMEEGKSFTVGEGQEMEFITGGAAVKGGESARFVNNGTVKFQGDSPASVETSFVNNGALYAPYGISCSHSQLSGNGTFHGAVREASGSIYYYGTTAQNGACLLGGSGAETCRVSLMPGAALSIPDGACLDASGNGITWDNLGSFLSMGEGSRIVVEEGGQLLLPSGSAGNKIHSLALSGGGTVKIGEQELFHVEYRDGETLLSSGFADGQNMVTEPDAPVKGGYTFRGWYPAPEGGEPFRFGSPVAADTVLYAQWDKNVMVSGGGSVSAKGSITYGQPLSELGFCPASFVEEGSGAGVTGILSWKNPTDCPKAGTASAEWVFTPEGSGYKALEGTAAITVEKASPHIQALPEASQITYGESLSQSALAGGAAAVAGGFSWKESSLKPTVADSGKTEFAIVFTPDDTENYNSVETAITLQVLPAEQAPNMPPGSMDVPNSCQKAGDVTLPEGWQWESASIGAALLPGVPVKATAVYAGPDKGNYKKETAEITITRVACPHGATKIRDAKAATCTEGGYTGDVYCTVCGAAIETGEATPPSGHSPKATVAKEPTKEAAGLREYRCTVCGVLLRTETIPKLSGDEPAQSPAKPTKAQKEKNAYQLSAGLKAAQTGKAITVQWGRVKGAGGYDVYVQYCGKKYTAKSRHTAKGGRATKLTIKKTDGKKLDLKKNYKIYVAAYQEANGKKVTLGKSITAYVAAKNSKKYTNAKAVKAQKASFTLKKGKTAQIKPKATLQDKKKKLLPQSYAKRYRYLSSNAAIASVSKTGKIKAKKKGSCTICVFAQNGCKKKIKVRVK